MFYYFCLSFELFIYAFKFQYIVKIEYMYVVQKIKSFIYS